MSDDEYQDDTEINVDDEDNDINSLTSCNSKSDVETCSYFDDCENSIR